MLDETDDDARNAKGVSHDRAEMRVRVPRELHAKLVRVAEREGRSVSSYVARLIEKDMKKQRV